MKIKINGTDFELPAGLNAALQAVLDAAMAAERESLSEQKSPFARGKIGDTYYYIKPNGAVEEDKDVDNWVDGECFAVANYCTDRAMMEQRALHETLNRLLWRYSVEHGGDKQPWNGDANHWYIGKNKMAGQIDLGSHYAIQPQGAIYFPDKQTAQAAIHDVVEPFIAAHPEFVW